MIFHNGFFEVRFLVMEQVFFMFLPLPCCTIQQVGVSQIEFVNSAELTIYTSYCFLVLRKIKFD